MHIRKGDNVVMLTGKDRGKNGKVLLVLPTTNQVVVEGLNLVKRHQRARKENQKGQIISKERAVAAANVQAVCPKCNQPTRSGQRVDGKNKLRVCKKCQADF